MSICSARGSKGDCLGVHVLSHRRRRPMADWTVPTLASKRLTRRHLLHGTLASAGLALGQRVLTGLPAVHAAEPMQLHIAGTGVNQYQQIATKAKEDLGVTIQYTSLVSDDVVKRAATQPTSFDLLDSEYWMLAKIIPTGNMRALDLTLTLNPGVIFRSL